MWVGVGALEAAAERFLGLWMFVPLALGLEGSEPEVTDGGPEEGLDVGMPVRRVCLDGEDTVDL